MVYNREKDVSKDETNDITSLILIRWEASIFFILERVFRYFPVSAIVVGPEYKKTVYIKIKQVQQN